MSELLPCPFCGLTESLMVDQEEKHIFSVVCSIHRKGCGSSSVFDDSAEKVTAAWNRRTPTAREPVKVTEASKVLELAEAYRATCGGRCAYWINPCADYETAEYI